jgi:dienelactone hydrolase
MVLVGGHDAEVPPDDFEAWKKALDSRPDAAIKFYPDLFHLFMPSTATIKGQDSQEDWGRPGHVSPKVVDDVASWILREKRN